MRRPGLGTVVAGPPPPPPGGGGGLYHAPWGPSSRIKIYLCLCKSRLAQFLSPSPKGQRKISENKSQIRLKDFGASSTLSLSVNNNKLQKEKHYAPFRRARRSGRNRTGLARFHRCRPRCRVRKCVPFRDRTPPAPRCQRHSA